MGHTYVRTYVCTYICTYLTNELLLHSMSSSAKSIPFSSHCMQALSEEEGPSHHQVEHFGWCVGQQGTTDVVRNMHVWPVQQLQHSMHARRY